MFVLETFHGAVGRLLALDPETFGVLFLTLKISLLATLLGFCGALPLAWAIHRSPPGRRAFFSLALQTLLAVPTVIVGTIVYLFLSRRGPLGALELMYTPTAIIAGDVLLIGPLMATYLLNAMASVPTGLLETARNLGAGPGRLLMVVLGECRFAVPMCICAGFGRVIAEVGCAMILGGNIRGETRTLTTAIALEMGKGETELGLALGLLLLVLALMNALAIQLLQGATGRAVAAADRGRGGAESAGSAEPQGDEGVEGASLVPTRTPPAALLTLRDLSWSYPGRRLFEGLSGDLPTAGGLALMGPSGVGKTTLLRLIAGLIVPERGRVDLGGRVPVLLFQRPYLFSGSVIDNLTFGLRCHGV